MNILFFIFLIFGLQILCLIIGKKASSNLKNNDDYYLAGKSVRFFPLMMTFLATQVGGGLFLGSTEEAYQYGWSVLFFPLGTSLGLVLLGLGIGKKLTQFKVSTIAQILEVAYRSPNLKRVASILSIVSLFMILVAQIIASQKFLISMGVSSSFIFILFWTVVIFYTVQGGLKAVIATDIVQASFFIVVFSFLFLFLMFAQPGSLQTVQNISVTFSSSKLYGWLFMPLLFMLIEQDMGQRCFAGGSPKIVSRAALCSGIVTFIICTVPIFVGILAKNQGIMVPKGSSVLITTIAQMTNPWITAVIGCAILAAIISTADSLINAIGSNLSSDFKLSFLKKYKGMSTTKGLSAAISIGAIFFSFYFDNIVDLMIQSYELSVSCLFAPIFIAFFKKNGNFLSALLSILCGALGFCIFRLFPFFLPKELASVLLSCIGYGVGEALIWIQSRAQKIQG